METDGSATMARRCGLERLRSTKRLLNGRRLIGWTGPTSARAATSAANAIELRSRDRTQNKGRDLSSSGPGPLPIQRQLRQTLAALLGCDANTRMETIHHRVHGRVQGVGFRGLWWKWPRARPRGVGKEPVGARVSSRRRPARSSRQIGGRRSCRPRGARIEEVRVTRHPGERVRISIYDRA